ncbi:hypothetical protein CLU79DRAFT_885797 [Phycomyces nitens]|nr:hypothetical protein CLU79DRAFT_885797 [Phycomyces nitens]
MAENLINTHAIDEDSEPLEEEEYEVESIIDHRCIKNKKKGKSGWLFQYLIKWKNYDESDNTWEDIKNVSAPELVEEHWKDRGGLEALEAWKKSGSVDKHQKNTTSKKKASAPKPKPVQPNKSTTTNSNARSEEIVVHHRSDSSEAVDNTNINKPQSKPKESLEKDVESYSPNTLPIEDKEERPKDVSVKAPISTQQEPQVQHTALDTIVTTEPPIKRSLPDVDEPNTKRPRTNETKIVDLSKEKESEHMEIDKDIPAIENSIIIASISPEPSGSLKKPSYTASPVKMIQKRLSFSATTSIVTNTASSTNQLTKDTLVSSNGIKDGKENIPKVLETTTAAVPEPSKKDFSAGEQIKQRRVPMVISAADMELISRKEELVNATCSSSTEETTLDSKDIDVDIHNPSLQGLDSPESSTHSNVPSTKDISSPISTTEDSKGIQSSKQSNVHQTKQDLGEHHNQQTSKFEGWLLLGSDVRNVDGATQNKDTQMVGDADKDKDEDKDENENEDENEDDDIENEVKNEAEEEEEDEQVDVRDRNDKDDNGEGNDGNGSEKRDHSGSQDDDNDDYDISENEKDQDIDQHDEDQTYYKTEIDEEIEEEEEEEEESELLSILTTDNEEMYEAENKPAKPTVDMMVDENKENMEEGTGEEEEEEEVDEIDDSDVEMHDAHQQDSTVEIVGRIPLKPLRKSQLTDDDVIFDPDFFNDTHVDWDTAVNMVKLVVENPEAKEGGNLGEEEEKGKMNRYAIVEWKDKLLSMHPLNVLYKKCPRHLHEYYDKFIHLIRSDGDTK